MENYVMLGEIELEEKARKAKNKMAGQWENIKGLVLKRTFH